MALLMAVANIIQRFAIREWFHRLVVAAIVNVAPPPLPPVFHSRLYFFIEYFIQFIYKERKRKKERSLCTIASHFSGEEEGTRQRETESSREGVSNYSMSIATAVERVKIHREFSIFRDETWHPYVEVREAWFVRDCLSRRDNAHWDTA